jgi:HAE1 family hydrophobic/amphiphilic exporter-1
MTTKKMQGLNQINRYNLHPSAAIQGAPAAGYSSGQAIRAVAAETLPQAYEIGWERLSDDDSRKGNLAVFIFLIVDVFVSLVLVGPYEGFLLPLAVILLLPVGLFGSFLVRLHRRSPPPWSLPPDPGRSETGPSAPPRSAACWSAP